MDIKIPLLNFIFKTLLLCVLIMHSEFSRADFFQLGARGQYDIFLDRSSFVRQASKIEFVAIFFLKVPFEFKKDRYYDRINVGYKVDCQTMNYTQKVFAINNSHNGSFVSAEEINEYSFAVPQNKLLGYLKSACKI